MTALRLGTPYMDSTRLGLSIVSLSPADAVRGCPDACLLVAKKGLDGCTRRLITNPSLGALNPTEALFPPRRLEEHTGSGCGVVNLLSYQ